MDIIALLKVAPVDAVDRAIRKAIELETDDPAAIALLVRQHATSATLPPVNLERRCRSPRGGGRAGGRSGQGRPSGPLNRAQTAPDGGSTRGGSRRLWSRYL